MDIDKFICCPYCASTALTKEPAHMACTTCGRHIYDNQAAAAGVVLRLPDNRVVLAKRARNPHKGKHDFPGGFVDRGENLEQAAVREIREELGLSIAQKDLRYICSGSFIYPFAGNTTYGTDAHFMADITHEEVESIRVRDDVAAVVSINPHDITREMVSYESTWRVILRIREIMKQKC